MTPIYKQEIKPIRGEAETALVALSPSPPVVFEPVASRPLSENPAALYLASLAPGSRRAMRHALDTMASLLTGEKIRDALTVDWAQIRYQHTTALRSVLMDKYSPATVNKFKLIPRRTASKIDCVFCGARTSHSKVQTLQKRRCYFDGGTADSPRYHANNQLNAAI